MIHLLYTTLEKNGLRRKSFLILFVITMSFMNQVNAQLCYKQDTGYLLKEVDLSTPFFFNRYKYGQISSCYSKYFIVDDETLRVFLDSDYVDFDKAVLLCAPAIVMFADSAITRDVMRFTRIKDLLLLDDSEIYEIGGKKYFIRKIRYAYYDNSQVKVYIKGYNYFEWDDISDEDTAAFNATYEVGQLYQREYYRCYHHLIEILPTPEHVSKHIWRRLYQLGVD